MNPEVMLSDDEFVTNSGPAPLDRTLRERNQGISWNRVRRAIRTGKISIDGDVEHDPRREVQTGCTIRVTMNAARHPVFRLPDDVIVRVDQHVVVVRKPSGIPSVPDENHRQGTLAQLIAARLQRKRSREVPLGVVQRLDAETSGLIVYTRTAEAHERLKRQFQQREVGRHYLALASGTVNDATFRSHLIEHKNGKRSSTKHRHLGKFACTHVERLELLQGASLIRCTLETGRTHQIRIHISEAGHPLLGDARYARRAVVTPPAPRVMLHAASLCFTHPGDGSSWEFEEAMPEDMQRVYKELRRGKAAKPS